MEIKGTAVKATEQFMKEKYSNLYLEWKKMLPSESKVYFRSIVHATKWYPLTESVIYPTETAAKLLNKNKEELAGEIGKYSAEKALSGVYKIFIRISNPDFVISRATAVFSTYYNPGTIVIKNQSKQSILAGIENFEKKDALIMYRIAGWMQGTLEATRRKTIHTELAISEIDDNKIICDVKASWS